MVRGLMYPIGKSIKNYRPYYAFGLYALAYALLSLVPPPAEATLARYHLSATGLRWLELTVLLPSFIAWFAAFYGYERLSRYSKLINDTKDGRHVATIANGLGVIAYLIPLGAILYSFFSLLTKGHPDLEATQQIIHNYLVVLVPLVSFIIIERGTRSLSESIKSRPSHLTARLLTLLFIIIGVVYSYLVVMNADTPLFASNTPKAYYMPDILVLLTIVVPYLYMWFIGMSGVTELLLYSQKIKGIIFKRSWAYITWGLSGVIVASIIIQYVISLTGKLNHLHLNGLLAVVYGLLLLQAVGYIVIAVGAKKLQKIEEV